MSIHKDRVTIYDVARRAGVSPATVSRVINNRDHVDPRTRKLVEEAIAVCDFVPNQLARSLHLRVSRTIGLVVQSLNSVFSRFCQEMEQVCEEQKYGLLFGASGTDGDRERRLLRDMVKRQVDGFILLGGSGNLIVPPEPFLQTLAEIKGQLPLVFVNGGFSISGFPRVQTDEKHGFGLVLDHLLSLGHRKIALVTGQSEVWTTEQKTQGYIVKMKDAGIAVDARWIRYGLYTIESGIENALALLALDDRPTAIACTNDTVAVGVVSACLRSGVSVPGEVSVTGFDDIQMARYFIPSITTVSQPYDLLAREAMRLLLAGDKAPNDGHQGFQGALIARESTGLCRE